MEKRTGLNRMLLATTLVGFTLGLTSSVGVSGAFAEARDEFQAPRGFHLNTSFNETPSSQAREGFPTVMIHPDDAATLGIADGDAVTLGNTRGETTLTAKLFDGLRRGVLIAESIHPNKAHIGGRGINMLTGATSIAPESNASLTAAPLDS